MLAYAARIEERETIFRNLAEERFAGRDLRRQSVTRPHHRLGDAVATGIDRLPIHQRSKTTVRAKQEQEQRIEFAHLLDETLDRGSGGHPTPPYSVGCPSGNVEAIIMQGLNGSQCGPMPNRWSMPEYDRQKDPDHGYLNRRLRRVFRFADRAGDDQSVRAEGSCVGRGDEQCRLCA
jgi:hypothetical protein